MTNLAENTVVKPKTNSHQLVIKPKKNSHHLIDEKEADDSSIDGVVNVPAISHQNASSEGGEGVTAEESPTTDDQSQPVSDLVAALADPSIIKPGIPLKGEAQKSIPVGWWVRIPNQDNELAQVQSYYSTGACVDGQKGAYGVYPAIVALSKNEMIALGLRWVE